MSTPPNAENAENAANTTNTTNAPDRFDAWLRGALHTDTEPADAAFLARVMDTLPPQPAPAKKAKAGSHGPWRRHAEGICMGAVAIALALVLEPSAGIGPLDQSLAGACLVGLLLWWALPQLRGSDWR